MNTKQTTFAATAAQVVVGLVLVYAAITKGSQIPMFAYVVQQGVPFMAELSTPMLLRVAQAIMFIEAIVGISLVLHFYSRITRIVAIALFFVFSGVLVVMLTKNKALSCGCMGFTPEGLGGRAELIFGLIRNFFLIAILVIVAFMPQRLNAQDEEQDAPAGSPTA